MVSLDSVLGYSAFKKGYGNIEKNRENSNFYYYNCGDTDIEPPLRVVRLSFGYG